MGRLDLTQVGVVLDPWRDEKAMKEFLAWRKDSCGKARATIIRDWGVLDAWVKWINHPSRREWDITADVFERFAGRPRNGRRNMGGTGSPSTRKADIACMRSVGKFFQARGWTADNPAALAVAPTVPGKTPHPLSDDEWLRLWHGTTDASGTWLLAAGGLFTFRRAEITAVRIETWRDGMISPMVRKGGSQHSFPYAEVLDIVSSRMPALLPDPQRVIAAVEELRAGRSEGPLVPRWDRFRDNVINRDLAALCEAVELDPINPHRLRDTAITNILRCGVPLHLVQELAAHSDPAMTARYARRGGSELAEWRRREGF